MFQSYLHPFLRQRLNYQSEWQDLYYAGLIIGSCSSLIDSFNRGSVVNLTAADNPSAAMSRQNHYTDGLGTFSLWRRQGKDPGPRASMIIDNAMRKEAGSCHSHASLVQHRASGLNPHWGARKVINPHVHRMFLPLIRLPRRAQEFLLALANRLIDMHPHSSKQRHATLCARTSLSGSFDHAICFDFDPPWVARITVSSLWH